MSALQFEGKVAIVTGAGSGIGAASARALAAHGAMVVLADVDGAAAAAAADRCAGVAHGLACDVRREQDCASAVEYARAEGGRLDIVVNSAGIVRYGSVTDLRVEDWEAVLDTNLKAVFLLSKHAVPLLRAGGGGSVVSVSSAQAFASQALVVAYSATKGALVAMTRTLAIDHAPDRIRFNCVAPGSVETTMLRGSAERLAPEDPAAAIEAWGRSHLLGRVITADEVANVIVFLASDASSAVTGATYLVDGGLTARLAT